MGAGVSGAGVFDVGVLGAGVLGAGVLGAVIFGAGVVAAGVLGAVEKLPLSGVPGGISGRAPEMLGNVLGNAGPLGLMAIPAGSSLCNLGVAGCLFSLVLAPTLCSFSLNTEVSLKTTALITPLICSSGHDPKRILCGLPRPLGRKSPGS